jgi:hypothetical protein
MVGPKGSLGSPEDWPNRRRSRESPRGPSRQGDGEGFGPSRDPNGVPGGFGRAGFRDSGGVSALKLFEGAIGEASASMRALGNDRASARPDPPRETAAGLSGFATATRRGSARGSRASLRDPPGPERGASLAPGPRENGGASRPGAIPKPPSARWPRHPATAVKAGTSGGRWRHRPPLSFPGPARAGASVALLPGPQALSFLETARRHEARSDRLRLYPQHQRHSWLWRFAPGAASCLRAFSSQMGSHRSRATGPLIRFAIVS